MRGLANWNTGFPHCTGSITHNATTLAEMLRPHGYSTFAVGKWYLTPMEETSAAGPFDQWPLARGFDRFYGFKQGETDQFAPELYCDSHPFDRPRTPEQAYHLTEDLIDQVVVLKILNLHRSNDYLRSLFIPLHTWLELQDESLVHSLSDTLWDQLQRSTERRAMASDRMQAHWYPPSLSPADSSTGFCPRFSENAIIMSATSSRMPLRRYARLLGLVLIKKRYFRRHAKMNESSLRRHFLKASAALAAASALPLYAQDKGPLRIIVPLPAGGVADASVRFFAEAWTNLTKQQVVVDNRPGGSFLIGIQSLLTAPADGNTWIHLNNGMSAAQATFGRYDLTKQITPIGLMGSTHSCIFVNHASPHQSAKDLLDWLKANPGKANFGTVLGGIEHLLTASILKRHALSATMVPFKGGPDTMTGLAQNEIHFAISALPLIVPFKGRIRPVAIMSDTRSPLMPDLPTFKEAGFEAPVLNYYGALAVHAATPKPIIEAHYKTASEAMKNPGLIQKFAQQGMFAHTSPGDAMTKIIADELKWMTPIAAELNLKAG